MKLEYNQRNFLRLVPAALLGRFFRMRGVLREIDWDASPEVDQINDALMALPLEERQAIAVDFQNAYRLAWRQGILTLLEVGRSRGLDLVQVMGKARTNIEKVFRVFLEEPRLFRVAAQFAWADGLKRYWHRRSDLPRVPANTGPAALEALRQALAAYFVKNEGRGEFCHIEVEQRAEALYFMVYLADYPAAVVCFEDSNELKRSLQQQAFDVVFIYYQQEGRLDLYAEGSSQKRKELAQMFLKHILGVEAALDEAVAPAFDLERLKDPAFRFHIEPGDGIAAMRPRAMRFSEPQGDAHTVTFSANGRRRDGDLYAWIERGLNQVNLPLDKLKVASVTIQAVLASGNPRPKTVIFTLTARNSCNLKDTPEHRKIREVLRRSEVICA
ncbi:MAG: hypothetical protein ACOYX1_02590 [Acidobacteriota bacterium]